VFRQLEYNNSKVGGVVVHTRPPHLLKSGVSVGCFSAIQSGLEPVEYLSLNPSHPVRADLDPSRELAGLFQSCDVLR